MGKRWPEWELQGLTARDIVGDKVILPIWYGVGFDDVLQVNPPLAQKRAYRSAGPSNLTTWSMPVWSFWRLRALTF
jgi:hypothetical protein